jgi:non-specific serine/threonine protein kinase
LKDLLDVDPLTPLSQGIEGFVELFDGNFARAVDPGRRIYKMDPKSDLALWLYTVFLAWNGRIDESPWNSEWAKTAEPESTVGAVCRFLNHALTGQDDAAVRSLPPDIEQAAGWDEQMSWEIAAGYALLDRPREALDWLENAVNRGFLNYPFLSEYDPFLENIRGERRFKVLIERVKHEWENIDV